MRNGDALRVKICGITRPRDAEAAAVSGADAIGLNFVGGPRQIDVRAATDILRALAPMCTPVALVDLSSGQVPKELRDMLLRFRVSHLQLYGGATTDAVAHLAAEGFKPIIVKHVSADRFPDNVQKFLSEAGDCQPAAVLLDAHVEGMRGGTGTIADWQAIARARQAGRMSSWPPVILAGGLTPQNVTQAVTTVRPWAVDVSSGVESAVGRKDRRRMMAFVANARGAARGPDDSS